MPAVMPSEDPPIAQTVNGMSNTRTSTAPRPRCPWPWCRTETETTIGADRLTAHSSAVAHVAVPPDEVNVYLVAVDDQAPNVVIEQSAGDPTTLVLTADQADRLAAALAVTANTSRPT